MTTNARVRVTADTSKANASLDRFKNRNKTVADGVLGSWKGIIGKGGAVAAGLTGILGANAAIQLGQSLLDDYAETTRTLVSGTGATGDRLAELREVLTEIGANVPASLNQLAAVVADLDTAFTGFLESSPALFESTGQLLGDLNNVLGEGTSSAVTRLARGYGVAEYEVDRFADVFVAKNAETTASTGEFTSALQTGTSTLQAFGFEGAQAVELVSNLLNENIKFTNVQTGLNRVLQDAQKQGRDAREVLAEYTQNIEMATTDTEKLNLASEYFGSRGGAAMLNALDAQAFTLSTSEELFAKYAGSVDDAADAITDLGDVSSALFNRVSGEFSEFIGGVISSTDSYLEKSGRDIDDLVNALGSALFGATSGVAGGGGIIGGITGAISGAISGFNERQELERRAEIDRELARRRAEGADIQRPFNPGFEGGTGAGVGGGRPNATVPAVVNVYNGPVIGGDSSQVIQEDQVREAERSGIYDPFGGNY